METAHRAVFSFNQGLDENSSALYEQPHPCQHIFRGFCQEGSQKACEATLIDAVAYRGGLPGQLQNEGDS